MNCTASRFRIGLIVLVAISLVACPLAAGGFGLAGANAQISFTPNIPSLELTQTAEVTTLGTIGAPLTATPFPAPTQETTGAISAPSCAAADEETIGYDFLGGSDPPLWRICFGGEVLIVDATDPVTGDLLGAFRAAADLRAQGVAQFDDARSALRRDRWTLAGGVVGLIGGGIAAVGTCSATPLTLGTTFLVCVGSGAASLGGLVTTVVSALSIGADREARDTAQATIDDSTADSEQYFRALRERTNP